MKEKNLKVCLIVVIIVLILIIVGMLAYNVLKPNMIVSTIEEKQNALSIGSNYSYTMTHTTYVEGDKYEYELVMEQYYVDNDKFSATINTYGNNGNTTAIAYRDNTDDIIIYDNGENKLYKINGESNTEVEMEINPTDLKSFSQEILSRIKNNIDNIVEESKDDKDCYVITTKDFNKYWIEKETGIVISYIEDNDSFDMKYSIGNVTDDNFVKPNTSEYL